MKTWFASRDAGVLLSFVALLSLLARSYVDTDLILPEFTGLILDQPDRRPARVGRSRIPASQCHGVLRSVGSTADGA